MNICICDDNPIHLKNTASIVESYFRKSPIEDLEISALTPEELLLGLEKEDFPYFIAVLDIELEKINGIEAAKIINRLNPDCKIIFITSFSKFRLEVYEADHVYFVPKDMSEIYLTKALDKVLNEMMRYTESGCFYFQAKGKVQCVSYRDVLYFEQNRHKTQIYTVLGMYYSTVNKLSSVLQKLEGETQFIQTHKSFVVNLQYVEEFKRTCFILKNSIEVPISRTYCSKAKESFLSYVADRLL